ncbi:cytochrome P450 2C20-like [Varanus komodoensis]|uniref:cytochrome P450 2C20-like n=1 Tax=Varanus komodoensis TaxID=61221 RepID=UPI001CF7C7ED|nr:cytochrome P450 2C20-like [Varanus komodoensis]
METIGADDILLFCVLFTLFFSSFKLYKKKSQLPPGPVPWFFLGNLLKKDMLPLSKYYSKFTEKYGPIFTVWLGPKPLVVLCGYEVVKDALVHHAEEFGGRPFIPVHDKLAKGQGFLGSKDETKWRELRRFTLTTLRDFGMGKNSMSERIREESLSLLKEIAATQGKPFDPQGSILTANANVMSSLIYGEYFDYKDEWFQEHINTLRSRFDFFRSFPAILYNSLPQIMDYFPGFHQMMLADSEKLCASIREKIAVSRQNLDPQNPNGFIESFLVRSEEETNTVKDFYSDGDLVMSVFALFLAAAAVTSDALLFSLVLMAKHPHIQAKVQEEIDEAVGTMRLPCSEDRKRMPFTNAVVHECQRYQIFNPEILSRKVTCHIKFRGYSIPKGTTVLPLLTSVHYDPLQWETPEKFNPNHFLDEKGHFRRRDAFMPFSAGKRSCLGESLARMELFLFFSILLQKFTFQMAGEAKNMDPFSLFLAYKRRKHPQMEAIRRSV